MHKLFRASVLVACALVCSALGARGQSSPDIESRITALIARMTLEEKLGQLQQLDGADNGAFRPEHSDLARRGLLGSMLNVRGWRNTNQLQRIAVEQSRLKIPLIFGFDVIHGYRTVFPIPLGEAASWDPEAARASAAVAAAEAKSAGVDWTFAPMVDIARDARWGRIAEGSGEDPFLGAAFARARVMGFQGDDYSRPDKVVACPKHWVAYGAAEGGRDYNTVDMSERTLRTIYFPPFKAAVDAGAATLMSAFDSLNGVPASVNTFTLTDVLRSEWKFDGFVVSDWNAVIETINHGVAADQADAARQALAAGVDMEMVSRAIATNGAELVRSGRVPIAAVDEAVRRVLRVKMRAGLFEHPYVDESLEARTLLAPEHRQLARRIAARSMVLMRNENQVLPLPMTIKNLAVIGPLADNRRAMLGPWSGDGHPEDAVTLVEGIKATVPPTTVVRYVKGVDIEGGAERPDFSEALQAASAADAVVVAVGEGADMSGEAASRATLGLPGHQQALADAILATGKPVAVVLFNGRPLAIPELATSRAAILEAWFPGTEAGNAIADVLFGKVNPGGKLPVSFPRAVGQEPLYYNHLPTGRPPVEKDKYTSKYLDVAWTALFPFGHGLSYTTFQLQDLRVSAPTISAGGRLTVSVDVLNTGAREGDEVVQLYVRDPVASVSRPLQELKGFERVTLRAGERRRVEFTIAGDKLGFYARDMRWVVEPGEFRIRVGTGSVGGLESSFRVVP